ncbi:MAG: hypothetical protein KDC56_01555 [Flavobacteriaceae bacterium]|nr:hypothetical protein [Flavobacteriaceae bacterium]
MSISIEDHHIIEKCWKNEIKIYSNSDNQIIIEKNGEVVKIFNTPKIENVSKKIVDAYKYYHSRGFVI